MKERLVGSDFNKEILERYSGKNLAMVDPSEAKPIVKLIKKVLENDRGGGPQELSFYLNPSCPLRLFDRLQPMGLKVATVAGSGDFYQQLLALGSESVDVFDVSLPALAYSELQLAGILNLSREEYYRCFLSWSSGLGGKILDEKIFKRLKGSVSEFTASFWAEMIRMGYHILDSSTYQFGGVVRYRPVMYRGGLNKYIENDTEWGGDWGSRVRFVYGDIGEVGSQRDKKYDLIYISNVGYYFGETLLTAMSIKERMKKSVRIAFSKGSNGSYFSISQVFRRSVSSGELVNMRNIRGNKKFSKVYNQSVPVICHIMDEDVVCDGEIREVWYGGESSRGMSKVKFLGYDHCVGCGVLLEV